MIKKIVRSPLDLNGRHKIIALGHFHVTETDHTSHCLFPLWCHKLISRLLQLSPATLRDTGKATGSPCGLGMNAERMFHWVLHPHLQGTPQRLDKSQVVPTSGDSMVRAASATGVRLSRCWPIRHPLDRLNTANARTVT